MPPRDSLIDRFEADWRGGQRPSIAAVLKSLPAAESDEARRELALELIKIDLEYRWRAANAAGRRSALRLEAYARRLPLLGPSELIPLDLIAEEYRARMRWGDAPPACEYFARFAHPRRDLIAALADVDRDLAREGVPLAPRSVRRGAGRGISDPAAPLDFRDYVLKRLIGSGGLSRVYAGLQISLGKEVALKVLKRRWWRDAQAVGRFLREAQIAAQLPREGIVGIHGLGRLPQGGYFMVLDLIDGRDLRALGQVGEVPLALRWTISAAEIVHRVHECGFLHGDIKPANVLVEHSGNVLLADFGMARPLRATASGSDERWLVGTPAFLAPECVGGPEGVSARTDVFGLGGILLWLLTGEPVHRGCSTDEVLADLARPDWCANAASRLPATVPAAVRELCGGCLARLPQDRPLSAWEVAAQLRACASRL